MLANWALKPLLPYDKLPKVLGIQFPVDVSVRPNVSGVVLTPSKRFTSAKHPSYCEL